MNRIRNFFRYDLWILFLDIFAVNAAYYSALVVRFYVNFEFGSSMGYYLERFLRIAPYYTVLAIIVFAFFRLYGGMWTYAGLNDMNRIIGACITTSIIQVIVSFLIVGRMPITYYVLGALFQLLAVMGTRFFYRFFNMEKGRIEKRRGDSIPALVVGSGEYGQKIVRHLFENTPFRVVLIAGNDRSRFMDGIPVIPMEDIQKQIDSKKIQAIFIADENLTNEQRKELEATGLEVQDYTGYLSNLSGVMPLSSLLEVTEGPVTIVINGNEKTYASAHEAMENIVERYDVKSIYTPRIELKKNYTDESWIKEYEEETGEDVSFF